MRTTRIFISERFVIFYNELTEAGDVVQTQGPGDSFAREVASFFVSGACAYHKDNVPPLDTRPADAVIPVPWVHRRDSITHTAFNAGDLHTVIVCVVPKTEAYMESLGMPTRIASYAPNKAADMKLRSTMNDKWDGTKRVPGVLDTEQFQGEVVFVDTPAYREMLDAESRA